MNASQATVEFKEMSQRAEQLYDAAYDHYFNGNWEQAEKLSREAVDLSPLEARYRLLLAQAYCARGYLSLATLELRVLKSQDPGNPGAKSLEKLLSAKWQEQEEECRRRLAQRQGIGWLVNRLAAIFARP